MVFTRFPFFVFATLFFSQVVQAQLPVCQSGPMEGYRGEDCRVQRIASSDGFVYTYTGDTKVIKKWSFDTGTIIQEWPTTAIIEGFRSISPDGRYIELTSQIEGTFWSSRLFDTQTGKLVAIDKMGVYALLPNNIAVVKDDKRKVMLYDMKSSKVKRQR